MRIRHAALALLSLFALTLVTGCGVSIRAVDDVTPATSPTTSSAIVATPTQRPASDPSPTSVAPTPTTVPATTAPTASSTAAPTAKPSPTPRPTLSPPVSQLTTPVQRPIPTPAPVAPTPTPAPTATPEPSAPSCADMPVRGFGLLWSSRPAVAQAVGCSLAPETGLSTRVQRYQNGVMIWLDTLTPGIDEAPWVIALIGDTAERYRVPADGPAWEDGLSEPAGAFKWAWENVYTVQQSIGAALDPWYATDAAIQRFEHGTMLWLRLPASGDKPMIYVFPDDLLTASATTYHAYVDQGAP